MAQDYTLTQVDNTIQNASSTAFLHTASYITPLSQFSQPQSELTSAPNKKRRDLGTLANYSAAVLIYPASFVTLMGFVPACGRMICCSHEIFIGCECSYELITHK